ncbi:MAG: peroxidase, partial [Pseudomonas stutzeri]|nr:peroxidase [Stutzerimonas stutzeri]NIW36732.1 peroxidase [Gemmatimonadota bacterium]
ADRAMLDYAAKLTRAPASVSEADVQALREAGFDDRAILDIAQITAYFAFVTRLADGLGVTLEDY